MSPPKTPSKRRSVPPMDPQRFKPSLERPVRAKARWMEHQMDIQPHQHEWAQLSVSMVGAVRVQAEGPQRSHSYLVPPSRAVWIPPHTVHAVSAVERADMRALYVHESALAQLGLAGGPQAWAQCRVLEVTPLMRELLQALATEPDSLPGHSPQHPLDQAREQALCQLLIDELRRARSLRLGLSLPHDKRLRHLCETMMAEPARHADIDGWATECGASARTLSRLFREELGTSFSQWRQQLQLAHALQLAAQKKPMNLIAAELGYASASAFSAMVTRAVGMPPSRFFERA
ncbi:AraC family transcriptional regulator [Roseateles flavus]|uniref:Helix-turn-helix transcriptional regulator n=1 Tax=Roseateles flavus TaxID=3149041 RepID=A0ABV0GA82_9BURK